MSTSLQATEIQVGTPQPERIRTQADSARNRWEHYLDWVGAALHLLAICTFVVAGAFTFRFIFFFPFLDGALVSLIIYALILMVACLAERSDPEL